MKPESPTRRFVGKTLKILTLFRIIAAACVIAGAIILLVLKQVACNLTFLSEIPVCEMTTFVIATAWKILDWIEVILVFGFKAKG